MKATDTNIWCLRDHLSRTDDAKAPAVAVPHLKRCIKAGLCYVENGKLLLTEEGKAAIENYGKPPHA